MKKFLFTATLALLAACQQSQESALTAEALEADRQFANDVQNWTANTQELYQDYPEIMSHNEWLASDPEQPSQQH